MDKTVLFSRPWHDEGTNYLYSWTEELLEKAEQLNYQAIDLQREKSNKRNFVGYLKKFQPHLLHLNGHGAPSVVTGHNNKPLLDQSNSKYTKGSIIYARSCSSAAVLGQDCVKNGAKCYIGYKKPFVIRLDLTKMQKPLEDTIASYTLGPSNKITMSLLKGHSAKKAFDNSQALSKKKLQKLMSSDAPEGASHIIMAVFSNMKNQVLLGKPGAKI
jgi:hypothetical protein